MGKTTTYGTEHDGVAVEGCDHANTYVRFICLGDETLISTLDGDEDMSNVKVNTRDLAAAISGLFASNDDFSKAMLKTGLFGVDDR